MGKAAREEMEKKMADQQARYYKKIGRKYRRRMNKNKQMRKKAARQARRMNKRYNNARRMKKSDENRYMMYNNEADNYGMRDDYDVKKADDKYYSQDQKANKRYEFDKNRQGMKKNHFYENARIHRRNQNKRRAQKKLNNYKWMANRAGRKYYTNKRHKNYDRRRAARRQRQRRQRQAREQPATTNYSYKGGHRWPEWEEMRQAPQRRGRNGGNHRGGYEGGNNGGYQRGNNGGYQRGFDRGEDDDNDNQGGYER